MRKILSVLIALTMLCSLIIPAATVTAADDLVGTDSIKVVGRRVGEQYQVSVYAYTARKAAFVTIRAYSEGGLNVKTGDNGKPILNIELNKDLDLSPFANQVFADGRIGFTYGGDSSSGGGDDGPILNGDLLATYTYEITGDCDEASFVPDANNVPMYNGIWDDDLQTFPTYDFNFVYDLEPLTKTETTAPDTETEPPVTETEPPVTETEPPVTETEPPVTETEPPVTETEPPVTETEPPVTETNPPETKDPLDPDNYDEHTMYARGEIVDGKYVVNVYQLKSPGVAGFGISLNYNTDALVLREAVAGNVIPNTEDTPLVVSDYTKVLEDGTVVPAVPFKALQLDDNPDANGAVKTYGDGILLTYVFDILDQDADHQIKIQPEEGWWYTDADFQAESIPATVENYKWFADTETEPPVTETKAPDTETEPPVSETDKPDVPPVFDEFTAYVVGKTEGNKINVTASLVKNPGIVGFDFAVSYNPEVVKLVEVVKGGTAYPADKIMMPAVDPKYNPFIAFGNDDAVNENGEAINFYREDGTFMNYVFEIIDPNGDPEFKFVAREGAWYVDALWTVEDIPDVYVDIDFGPKPPVTETEPPVTETEPPVTETEPPVTETEPPVTETEPPVTETEPPVTETEPPVTETEPPVTETEPPVTETEPPVTETEPPVTETEPPVTETEPATGTPVTDPVASDSESESAVASEPASDSETAKDTSKAPATTTPDNKDDAPQTGDKMMLIVIVMAVAVVSCGVVIVVRRKITSK